MARTVSVASMSELASFTSVVVPLVVIDGSLSVAAGVPATVNGVTLPTAISPEWCEHQGLRPKLGSSVTFRNVDGSSVTLVVTNGASTSLEQWRQIGAVVAKASPKVSTAMILSISPTAPVSDIAQALVEGATLASYSYKGGVESAPIGIIAVGPDVQALTVAVTEGVRLGSLVATGVNWAKHLIDMPAIDLHPKSFAKFAVERLEGIPNIDLEIWKDSKIAEERLGGLQGVNLGSAQPARLVLATYTPAENPDAPHIVLVGKGVTFDTGGLWLKTAAGMATMKTDMSGAAIVISVLATAAEMALPIRITAIAPLTENMTGGAAMRPGDVLKIRNGKTVEIINPDAEGRLILADGLSLAAEREPDAIIDIATLTGAQVMALGEDMGALFATDDTLAAGLLAASAESGELFWQLPLVDGYEPQLESDVADFKNLGKPGNAGAIVAALFLRNFTNGVAWAHLDIAGPSRADSARGYYQRGATAFGARTLLQYLITRSRQS